MQTTMARSSTEDPEQMHCHFDEIVPLTPTQIFFKEEPTLSVDEEVTPLTPTQIFFKEESISIQLDEMTPLTPLQVFPKHEPITSHVEGITPLTPLQVFPKQESIPSEVDEMTVLTPLQVFPKQEPVDEVTTLTPLQVFPKQEAVRSQLGDVQCLTPIQVFVKGEPESSLSDSSSDDSRSLVINLESSLDDSTGDSEPMIIKEKFCNQPAINTSSQKFENAGRAILSSIISLLLKPAPKKSKTQAERQREYRLRQKQKILNNPELKKKTSEKKIQYQRQYRLEKRLKKAQKINGDKPAKKTRADYQREYRLRKKLKAQLNSGSAEMIQSQEAGPVTVAQLTPSPDAEPTVTQHEAVIETVQLPQKEKAQEQLKNVSEVRQLKRVQQYPTGDHNLNEISQLPSQPRPTPHLPDNGMQQISNQHVENLEFDKLMQPQDFYDGGDGEHLQLTIKEENIKNEDNFNMDAKSPLEDDLSHPYIGYQSHESTHKVSKNMFVKNSFGHICNVCERLRFLEDVKSGTPDEENLLKEITLQSYVSDYTDSSDKLVISVEDPMRRRGPDPLRCSDDTGQITLDSDELFHSVPSSSDSLSSDSLSLDSPSTVKVFQCALCRKSYPSAVRLQSHKQSHTCLTPPPKHLFDELVPSLKPSRPTRLQHKCSNCGKSFSQLQLLMRHRLAHLSTALRKPFSSLQAEAPGTSAVPRRTTSAVAATSARRRAQKSASREQQASLSVRQLRSQIHRRMLS